MRYFKAFEKVDKPFIIWDLWANSLTELTEMGEEDNPLIIPENTIPAYLYDVCPLKIVGGELVNRTNIEMEAFEAEYINSTFIQEQRAKLNDVNSGSFNYDSKTFPMDERSRLFYYAVDKKPPLGGVKCMTVDGKLYDLDNVNISAFLDAYYTKLKTLSQPEVQWK